MSRNILFIVRNFEKGGGEERTAAELGSKFHNKGYNIYYLSFLKPSIDTYKVKGKHFSLIETVYRFDLGKGIKIVLKDIIKVIRFKFRIFTYPKIIKNFTKNYKIDLIISFGEYNNLACLLSKIIFKNNTKLIVSIRNNPDLMYTKDQSILKYFIFKIITIKYLYKKADVIIPNFEADFENILYNYNPNKNNVKSIFNLYNINHCIKLSKEKIPFKYNEIFENSFVFINIGRIVEQKGQIHLIKSFKKVVDKNNKIKLVILGEGSLKNDFEKLVKLLNLQTNIFFIGIQSNVFPFLKRSNCFIFTSLWEGFPNVIVEALSMNIPIISTDCKYGPRTILCPELDISEKVNYPYFGKYGILTKPFFNRKALDYLKLSNGEKILSNLMIKIIEDPHLKKKFSKGIIRAKDFSEEKIFHEWEKIIKQLLS